MHELLDLSCEIILAQPKSWVSLAPLPGTEGVELVEAGVVVRGQKRRGGRNS
jgi:hypothetical protein